MKKIEKEMLYYLSKNSRINLSELSKILKTSKQVISYNLNKLIKEGIIIKFFPIIDYSSLGMIKFRILIRLSNVTPEKEARIIELLRKHHNAKISKIDNYFDIVADIIVKNVSELSNLTRTLEEKYGKYILEHYTDIIIKKEYFTYMMFKSKNDIREIDYNKNEAKKIDDADFKILKELEKNSRTEYAKLSSSLHMNPKTIVYRIKRLEREKVIMGYSIDVDWKKLGKTHYRVLIDTFIYNKEKFKELKEHIKNNKNVIAMSETLSKYLLDFDIISDNYNELVDFLYELRRKFAELIRNYDVLYVRE